MHFVESKELKCPKERLGSQLVIDKQEIMNKSKKRLSLVNNGCPNQQQPSLQES